MKCSTCGGPVVQILLSGHWYYQCQDCKRITRGGIATEKARRILEIASRLPKALSLWQQIKIKFCLWQVNRQLDKIIRSKK